MNNVLEGIVAMWAFTFSLIGLAFLLRFAVHHPFVGGAILITLFGAVMGIAAVGGGD